MPNQRRDDHDVVYKNERARFKAVIKQIAGCHERGQPVLIGTVSVEKSEVLGSMLRKQNIPHTVLNASRCRAPQFRRGEARAANRRLSTSLEPSARH